MDFRPSFQETETVIRNLTNGKSPGIDGIPAEILKFGGAALHSRRHEVLSAKWEAESIPQQWRDAKIVSIYKKKGDRAECGNSRGIYLLAVPGNVLAKLLLNRLNRYVIDKVCPESQCGFRSKHGTVDIIFVARELKQK